MLVLIIGAACSKKKIFFFSSLSKMSYLTSSSRVQVLAQLFCMSNKNVHVNVKFYLFKKFSL